MSDSSFTSSKCGLSGCGVRTRSFSVAGSPGQDPGVPSVPAPVYEGPRVFVESNDPPAEADGLNVGDWWIKPTGQAWVWSGSEWTGTSSKQGDVVYSRNADGVGDGFTDEFGTWLSEWIAECGFATESDVSEAVSGLPTKADLGVYAKADEVLDEDGVKEIVSGMGFVSGSDDLVSTDALGKALEGYAKTTDLSGYALATDVVSLAGRISGLESGIQGLEDYATKDYVDDALSGYVKTGDLNGYLVDSDLAGYVKTGDLAGYVRTGDLAELSGRIDGVAGSLNSAGYATTGYVDGKVEGLAKKADLLDWATRSEVEGAVSTCAKTSELSELASRTYVDTYLQRVLALVSETQVFSRTTALTDAVGATSVTVSENGPVHVSRTHPDVKIESLTYVSGELGGYAARDYYPAVPQFTEENFWQYGSPVVERMPGGGCKVTAGFRMASSVSLSKIVATMMDNVNYASTCVRIPTMIKLTCLLDSEWKVVSARLAPFDDDALRGMFYFYKGSNEPYSWSGYSAPGEDLVDVDSAGNVTCNVFSGKAVCRNPNAGSDFLTVSSVYATFTLNVATAADWERSVPFTVCNREPDDSGNVNLVDEDFETELPAPADAGDDVAGTVGRLVELVEKLYTILKGKK